MTLFEMSQVRAGYGQGEVLHGVDLSVEAGEVVVVLGANGAGKTTTMRAIAGLIPSRGRISLEGRSISGSKPDSIVRVGISLVPQGRGTFTKLTVEENLLVGAATRSDRRAVQADVDKYYEMFPVLARRSSQLGGNLSGGEQQMLALARGLIAKPKLLLCDEPSLGLAPIIVQELFATLSAIKQSEETAMLIVEQNADLALELADRVYLLEVGSVVSSGPAVKYRESDAIRRSYLGY